MEARFKSKKVTQTGVSTFPKREPLPVKSKSLAAHLRRSVVKKSEPPPLTPLTRLHRFKAIRDRNLKKASRGPQLTKKMAEVEANPPQQQESLKDSLESTSDSPTHHHPSKPSKPITQSEDKDQVVTNGQNGHVADETKTNGNEIPEENGLNKNDDDNKVTNGDDNKNLNENEEIIVDDDFHLSLEPDDKDIVVNENDGEEIISVEDDRGSTVSSSTLGSTKELVSSKTSDVPSETVDKVDEEESSDVEIEIENNTLSTDDEKAHAAGLLKGEEESTKEIFVSAKKSDEVLGRAGQVVGRNFGSASSYKTAYSSSRISGRRAVGGSCGMSRSARKRKAEEELSTSASEASPRWRFFRSSVSRLWTPPTMYLPPTPLSSGFNDSMTVNFSSDQTINSHLLNDSELYSGVTTSPEPPQPPSKRSRWGCSLM